VCSNTVTNIWLSAAVYREVWCLINKQVISISCSSSDEHVSLGCIFCVFLETCSEELFLHAFFAAFFSLASLRGAQKNKAGMLLSGSITQEI